MSERFPGDVRPPLTAPPLVPVPRRTSSDVALGGGVSERPAERLARVVRQQVRRSGDGGAEDAAGALRLEPVSAHEAITREMVLALQREVTHLRGRLDALFYLMVGSVLLDVLLRLVGRGA